MDDQDPTSVAFCEPTEEEPQTEPATRVVKTYLAPHIPETIPF